VSSPGNQWNDVERARRRSGYQPVRTNCIRLAMLALGALFSWPSAAANLDLMSVGVRARVGEKRVLGQEAPESFRAYDVVASFRLPWQRYAPSGWGVGTRLLTSAGVLEGAGKTALVFSTVPVLAFGSEDGRFSFDFGAGLALFSEHRFAQQDFGGPLQGALTFGASVALYRQLGVGYRFQHYSDAGAYGPDSIGVDFHMVEFTYRF
jgi:hypothetical protein